MTRRSHVRPADIRGLVQLTVAATQGLTGIVEHMHRNIASAAGLFSPPAELLIKGITDLLYGSVRGMTGLVGGGLDLLIMQLVPLLREHPSTRERETSLAILNGVLGDYLAASGNPLAITMQFRHSGEPLGLSSESILGSIPNPCSKILLLVHGLCANDLLWLRNGHNHGDLLAEEFGYTHLFLHYNSGLHISVNGRAFADMIETLLSHWPVEVEELSIVAHSMGGLVTRSACHYGESAGHEWRRYLRKIVFLGTPHHGAPLERLGNLVDVILDINPFTNALARLGKIRSAGITDLRYGNLLDEDWQHLDRFALRGDRRQPVPLPANVACYAIAATTGRRPGDMSDQLLGDGFVRLGSALGQSKHQARALSIPESRQWISSDTYHLDLLSRPEVYERMRQWFAS